MNLEKIEISTSDTPDASIIWLHGLGADGHDFEAIVPELNLPDSLAVRFVFPHAPYRPITLNNGYVMRGWYDIANLEFGSKEDMQGIKESSAQIINLIEQEQSRGIESNRIIIAGFSQGGAIALHTGLRYKKPLAGIMALSTYLPLASTLEKEQQFENKDTSIFMAHGLQDDILKFEFGVQSRILLVQNNYSIDWHDYPMAHSICIEEISHIREWLIDKLDKRQTP